MATSKKPSSRASVVASRFAKKREDSSGPGQEEDKSDDAESPGDGQEEPVEPETDESVEDRVKRLKLLISKHAAERLTGSKKTKRSKKAKAKRATFPAAKRPSKSKAAKKPKKGGVKIGKKGGRYYETPTGKKVYLGKGG